MRHALIARMVACLMLAVGPATAQKRDVDIKSTDGTVLKASYFPAAAPGPGIVLFHQCNMDRRAWDGLTPDLVAAGFHVMTLDLRGFGDTGGDAGPPPPPPPPPAAGRGQAPGAAPVREAAVPIRWHADADAALAFLVSQKDVDKTRLAAGGASCGVTLSADLASRHPQVKALVLMSGGVSNQGLAYIASTPALAVFGAAADQDEDAASIRATVTASKNSASLHKIYPGTEHGVPLFQKNPELKPLLVTWLKMQLGLR